MKYGIYIHIPFCRNICNYCNFPIYKHDNTIDKYVDYLCREIDIYFDSYDTSGKTISTLNFGGGTPTLLSSDNLSKIIHKLNQYLNLTQLNEFSVESNPGTFDKIKMEQFRNIGVNRVSIGVQSFAKPELRVIKRDHSPKKAETTIRNAIEMGFDSVNLDLMFSLPTQSIETWEETLNRAVELGTDHISTYSLTYEENTPLHKLWEEGKINKKSDEYDADTYDFTINKLYELGLYQYEVSNFSKPGKQCQHNLDNWHCNEYFAFGTGSHGFVNDNRYWNYRDIKKYYDHIDESKLPRQGSRKNLKIDKIKENLFLPIRADGINFKEFERNTSYKLEDIIGNSIQKFVKNGLMENDNKKVFLNKKGYSLCDSVSLELITEAELNFEKINV